MRITALTAAFMLANTAQAMQALDDDALADVSGQAGISLKPYRRAGRRAKSVIAKMAKASI